MLKGLADNDCDKTLLSVYNSWLDSVSYRNSFGSYLTKHKLDSAFINSSAIWQVNPDHPFRQVDEAWLKELGNKLANKSLSKVESAQLVARLKQRHQSKQAQALGIVFWNDIIALLEFDPKDMSYLSSFAECVEFYKSISARLILPYVICTPNLCNNVTALSLSKSFTKSTLRCF